MVRATLYGRFVRENLFIINLAASSPPLVRHRAVDIPSRTARPSICPAAHRSEPTSPTIVMVSYWTVVAYGNKTTESNGDGFALAPPHFRRKMRHAPTVSVFLR